MNNGDSENVIKVIKYKKHLCILYVLLTFLLLLCVYLTTYQISQHKINTTEMYFDNILSIVELKAFDDDETVSYGSAVAIKENILITNAHVISYKNNAVTKNFDFIEIRFATETNYISAIIKKIDYDLDLAIIEISENILKPMTISNKNISTGQRIFAIGNAQNYGISIMEGIVAKSLATVQADGKSISAIQCDLNITEGNSGGALLNERGELIGITTFRLKDSMNNVVYGISFAIPIKTINEFLL